MNKFQNHQKQKTITIARADGKGTITILEKDFAKKYKRIRDPKINEDGSASLTMVDYYGNEKHYYFKTVEECNRKMGFGNPNNPLLMREKT